MKKHLPMILIGIILILTILAYAVKSNAETEEPGVPEEIAQEEFLLGDIDKDGAVTTQDAYKVLCLYASSSVEGGERPTEEQKRLGDVNEDGVLDGRDSSAILAYITNVAVNENDETMSIQAFLEEMQY